MSAAIRVLLVDDEKLILSSLRRLLSRRGFDVSVCESGPDALALLERESFDVIVSDYQMPGMTGIEFLREAAVKWPNIQRCMLTAQADREQLEAALRSGLLQRAFKKPWDNTALVAALQALAQGA